MPGPDIDTNQAGKAVSGTALGASIVEGTTGMVSDGLAQAGRMAGGVLRGIFGGLPWNMSIDGIVDAVAGSVPGLGSVVVDLAGVLAQMLDRRLIGDLVPGDGRVWATTLGGIAVFVALMVTNYLMSHPIRVLVSLTGWLALFVGLKKGYDYARHAQYYVLAYLGVAAGMFLVLGGPLEPWFMAATAPPVSSAPVTVALYVGVMLGFGLVGIGLLLLDVVDDVLAGTQVGVGADDLEEVTE